MTQWYEIDIVGEDYFITGYGTQVTPLQTARVAIADSTNNKLLVQIFDLNGNPVQGPFQFLTIEY